MRVLCRYRVGTRFSDDQDELTDADSRGARLDHAQAASVKSEGQEGHASQGCGKEDCIQAGAGQEGRDQKDRGKAAGSEEAPRPRCLSK